MEFTRCKRKGIGGFFFSIFFADSLKLFWANHSPRTEQPQIQTQQPLARVYASSLLNPSQRKHGACHIIMGTFWRCESPHYCRPIEWLIFFEFCWAMLGQSPSQFTVSWCNHSRFSTTCTASHSSGTIFGQSTAASFWGCHVADGIQALWAVLPPQVPGQSWVEHGEKMKGVSSLSKLFGWLTYHTMQWWNHNDVGPRHLPGFGNHLMPLPRWMGQSQVGHGIGQVLVVLITQACALQGS